jgi:hypothetical protein
MSSVATFAGSNQQLSQRSNDAAAAAPLRQVSADLAGLPSNTET